MKDPLTIAKGGLEWIAAGVHNPQFVAQVTREEVEYAEKLRPTYQDLLTDNHYLIERVFELQKQLKEAHRALGQVEGSTPIYNQVHNIQKGN